MSNPHREHIRPKAGTFYYGECRGVEYAAAVFEPTADATEAERVASQDEGSLRQYLVRPLDSDWKFLASDTNPDSGCAKKIPAALAALWGNCSKV
ncbi:hypothetical protein [Streptomyces sp. BK340]|uniref:hypothetical protein n=1 Tax=Streptomyces sp. BK340 TaxID=2572903 RepID=UPI00119DBDAE|nr:hypothetical protein [Streptomyces sp. BK340]